MYKKIYDFLWLLRMRVKILSNEDFVKLLSECNSQEKIHALILRYF